MAIYLEYNSNYLTRFSHQKSYAENDYHFKYIDDYDFKPARPAAYPQNSDAALSNEYEWWQFLDELMQLYTIKHTQKAYSLLFIWYLILITASYFSDFIYFVDLTWF